jgi:muramoyltetrapeptide carboxypeptidase
MIKTPKPLPKGGTIGITGPSGGIEPRFMARYELAKQNFQRLGYSIKEGKALFGQHKHVSANKTLRAQDFMAQWQDSEVDIIIPPWGGELLIEILPLIDFELIGSSTPKWVMGYSDISMLLFSLTTQCGIATAHGTNFMDSIGSQSDELTLNALKPLSLKQGETFSQRSSTYYQGKWGDIVANPEAPFSLSEKSVWKSLRNEGECSFSGMLLGGCLDVLMNLIGTPFAPVDKFCKQHAHSGVIFFLENCELTPCSVARTLIGMKYAGWFKNVNGILLGRSMGPDAKDPTQLTYVEAINLALADLNIPVIFDADIGHLPPQMTLINGAHAKVSFSNDQCIIDQKIN